MVIEQVAVLEQLNIMVIVLWAMTLGGIVGWERQLGAKPAGLRTHMLVSGAAALLTSITVDLSLLSPTGDPTRGIHAIITGIGFLGAGAILQQRGLAPSGLTTAATIMYTAVIGTAVAGGFGLTATAATLLAIVVLRLFSWGRPHGEEPSR
jgi:putative Mg2+ transporter-C (MgtC) family protein